MNPNEGMNAIADAIINNPEVMDAIKTEMTHALVPVMERIFNTACTDAFSIAVQNRHEHAVQNEPVNNQLLGNQPNNGHHNVHFHTDDDFESDDSDLDLDSDDDFDLDSDDDFDDEDEPRTKKRRTKINVFPKSSSGSSNAQFVEQDDGKVPCPFCNEYYKIRGIMRHITSAHPEKKKKRKNAK